MEKRTKITVRDLNLYYGENHALKDVNMNIRENCVTAFMDRPDVENQHS